MTPIPKHWSVVGICGYSGSGKTTLIEALIPRLIEDELSVAVIKHDAHGLSVDREGKDTYRFFAAGASVFAHDSKQGFFRVHDKGPESLKEAVGLLLRDHDIVLVEGHKKTPLPVKVWLSSDADEVPPQTIGAVSAVLSRASDRVSAAYTLINDALEESIQKRPLNAGLLVGGLSSRMGTPKQLITFGGASFAERIAGVFEHLAIDTCLIGSGEVAPALKSMPRLPDVPGSAGPVGGQLAAMRWQPDFDWIFAPCDVPHLTSEAIEWLLEKRTPGRWAVMPRNPQTGNVEPLLAWYGAQMRKLLEKVTRPIALANHPKVLTPTIPSILTANWNNINTPEERAGSGFCDFIKRPAR